MLQTSADAPGIRSKVSSAACCVQKQLILQHAAPCRFRMPSSRLWTAANGTGTAVDEGKSQKPERSSPLLDMCEVFSRLKWSWATYRRSPRPLRPAPRLQIQWGTGLKSTSTWRERLDIGSERQSLLNFTGSRPRRSIRRGFKQQVTVVALHDHVIEA